MLAPAIAPVLRARRIVLRAMEDSDAAGILAICGDPLVMKYSDEEPFPDLRTVGPAQGWFKKLGFGRDASGMPGMALSFPAV